MKGTIAVQVELASETTHTVTWIPANLNVKNGTRLIADGRTWEVVHVYPMFKQAFEGMRTDWKVEI